MKLTPMKPRIIIAQVDGSGTGATAAMVPVKLTVLFPKMVTSSTESVKRPESNVWGPVVKLIVTGPLPLPLIVPDRVASNNSEPPVGSVKVTSSTKAPE